MATTVRPSFAMDLTTERDGENLLLRIMEDLPAPPIAIGGATLDIGIPFDGMGCLVTFDAGDGVYMVEVSMFPPEALEDESGWQFEDESIDDEETLLATETWCKTAAVALIAYCFGSHTKGA